MARTRPTARLRPRPSSMEVEDPTPKKQKTSKVLEVSGLSDLGIINRILGFALVYSFPIKRAIGYSGYSARPCVFSAYPVLYREPIGSGALPLALSNGDVGYFLGASDPSNIRTVIPYQVFRNIVSYHREMAIAKNKMNVLMIAKSLLGRKPAETIYRMAADGVLYIDDEDDANLVKAQNVRYLESRMNDYITELGQPFQDWIDAEIKDHYEKLDGDPTGKTRQQMAAIS